MRKTIMLSTAAVLTTLMFSSTVALAQRPGGPGRGGPGPGLRNPGAAEGQRPGGPGRGRGAGFRLLALGRQLNLTDDQRAKIRTIVQGVHDEAAPTREALRSAMQELRAARQSESADATRVQELQAKVTSFRQQMAELRQKARPLIADVLTAEQKQRLGEARRAPRTP